MTRKKKPGSGVRGTGGSKRVKSARKGRKKSKGRTLARGKDSAMVTIPIAPGWRFEVLESGKLRRRKVRKVPKKKKR